MQLPVEPNQGPPIGWFSPWYCDWRSACCPPDIVQRQQGFLADDVEHRDLDPLLAWAILASGAPPIERWSEPLSIGVEIASR